MQPKVALLLALVACSSAAARASGATPAAKQAPKPAFNWDNVLTEKNVPLVKLPSLAPSILQLFKLAGVKGDAPQNATNNPALIKLSTLMPKLPVIPQFDVPAFTAATTDAQFRGNVSLAVAALRVPLTESVMLPQYVSGLAAKVKGEAAWLDTWNSDPAARAKACGGMGQFGADQCVAVIGAGQSAKVSALTSSLDVLKSMQGQLNADLATKLAAFNVASPSAPAGSWLCALADALDAAIKAAAGSSTSASYASKATSAVAKLSDFVGGRVEGSQWWPMQEGTKIPKLVVNCTVAV